MSISDWKVYGICPNCGFRTDAPFGKRFFIRYTVCPCCGTPNQRFDLRAAHSVMLLPGQKTLVGTGVKVAIPEGHVGLVLPRSGLSVDGIVVIPGTIDSGYRGEIKVLLYNLAYLGKFAVHTGDRIAQLVVLPVVRADFQLVDDLPPGDRAENGFGSTGVD